VPATELRVHIIGLAGSGKTTFARWIGDTFGVPVHDLDWIAYDQQGERPLAEVAQRVGAISNSNGWVTEGAFQERWIEPLLTRATAIVWLDVPLHVCLFRMLKRHVRAELSRKNQHPGWRKLFRFMNYTRHSARHQRQRSRGMLAPHGGKTARCRTSSDIEAMKARLLSARE
jgi:adenylate kinase family enzyme